jgi:hypothetical protein
MADLFKSKTGPHTVEAIQLTADNVNALALWCGGVAVVEHDVLAHDVTYAAINVPTRVGKIRAQETDWIMRQPDGSFHTIHDHQFHEVFEPVV